MSHKNPIIELIERNDASELSKVLQRDSSRVNEYFTLEIGEMTVQMTPLIYAVKKKAVHCVSVLLKHPNTDVNAVIKNMENPLTAEILARGERKNAQRNYQESDVKIYDQIVKLFKHRSKTIRVTAPKEKTTEEAETSLPTEIDVKQIGRMCNEDLLGINRAETQIQAMKKDVEQLKRDIAALKDLATQAEDVGTSSTVKKEKTKKSHEKTSTDKASGSTSSSKTSSSASSKSTKTLPSRRIQSMAFASSPVADYESHRSSRASKEK
eukprot:TRINITY_DN924_c0_g1_i2.p2 TRINITY_DN924_c0_g1~~TRINITY_DN924_c0_g1_i2.p2  ORF type:complete len:267 (+),score=67.28 TRINITY_DN924_c0_g1_i2:1418-2218(+)